MTPCKSAILILLLVIANLSFAKTHSGGSHSGSHASGSSSHVSSGHRSPTAHSGTRTSRSSNRVSRGHHSKAAGVKRDKHGKIARSQHAKTEFKKSHPCPATGKSSGSCPGYVIDHVQALKRGGADAPSNLQWQTKEAAKQKDRWE